MLNEIITRRSEILKTYEQLVRKRLLIITLLGIGVLISLIIDISTGPSFLSPSEVVQGLFSPTTADNSIRVIIWQVRLPYAVMAILVGMALSTAGAEMQTILSNPLASPFTLGVSAAASFGAALSIILGLSIPGIPDNWVISANAFVFAFASVMLLQLVVRLQGATVETLVLFGIALVFTFNALVALTHFVASAEALQQFIFWSMGSLSRSNWDKVRVLMVVVAAVVPFTFASSWKMTTLRLGEERAMTFGINIKRLRFFSMLRISLLAATAVAFVGTIGFVGLVGPHVARMLVGEDRRLWFPASLLTGALIMSLASIASKMLIPGVLMPVGIVTALVGVPVFIFLIIRKGRVKR